MSDKRPAADTQARRLPDSFKGEPRAPGEARGVSRRLPSPPFGKGPSPKAPGISAMFLSLVTVAHNRRFCPLYAENDEPYFPGWGESFRDVRVQDARPVPRTAGTRHRGRVSGAHGQSGDSRYPAAARCQALCQRFPLVISWRARVTGGSGWWSRGPNLPATPGRGESRRLRPAPLQPHPRTAPPPRPRPPSE